MWILGKVGTKPIMINLDNVAGLEREEMNPWRVRVTFASAYMNETHGETLQVLLTEPSFDELQAIINPIRVVEEL